MYVKQAKEELKENYTSPRAKPYVSMIGHSTLNSLSYPGEVDANFGGMTEQEEWGNQ